MPFETIIKPPAGALPVTPNLSNYEGQRSTFSWDELAKELDGLPGGGLNIAYEALDRHVAKGNGDKPAILWEGKTGDQETYTFADMARLSNKWCDVLRGLGVQKGDRVFVFLDRIPELYAAVFGTLKAGCVIGPLFSAFGPDAVRDRMENSGAVLLLTSPDLWRKIAEIRNELPALKHVVHVQHGTRIAASEGILSYDDLMDSASDSAAIEKTGLEDRAIMHYTSGTTGKPKGAVHVHQAVWGHYATGKYVLDLHPDDIYWCTADPGWVTGTSYGMFAPFTNGVTSVIYEGGFSASKWYEIIQRYKVTVWYSAPTAIRLLMRAGDEIPKRYDLSSLRYAMSVGEPLNPECVVWSNQALGLPFHDNWWQTETGSIMIANYPTLAIKPGSMGKPMLGINPGIIDEDGNEVAPGVEGDLAVRPGWPSMFRTYWQDEER
ncbi:MAG TPA: AMP-binding protein, partial [Dehalococcoidia bacterium]|nr:AMP-binding protein [Dehalococcoidia bacterium]